MKISIYFILLLLTSTNSSAEISFAQLASVTKMPEALEGSFKQTRYLKSLDVELKSNGVFSYTAGGNLRWEILHPIKHLSILQPHSASGESGSSDEISTTGNSSAFPSIINSILFSVLTTNWESLSQYFILTGNIHEQNWNAELEPADNVLKTSINRITLNGSQLLQSIVVEELDGDITTIEFNSR